MDEMKKYIIEFAEDANVYEASDLKKWIENWAKRQAIALVADH